MDRQYSTRRLSSDISDFTEPIEHIVRATSDSVKEAVHKYGSTLRWVHIAITVAFLCFGGLISYKVTHAKTDNNRLAWQYVSQAWMGTNQAGIFWNIFKLWIATIVFTAIYPVVMNLFTKLKPLLVRAGAYP